MLVDDALAGLDTTHAHGPRSSLTFLWTVPAFVAVKYFEKNKGSFWKN